MAETQESRGSGRLLVGYDPQEPGYVQIKVGDAADGSDLVKLPLDKAQGIADDIRAGLANGSIEQVNMRFGPWRVLLDRTVAGAFADTLAANVARARSAAG